MRPRLRALAAAALLVVCAGACSRKEAPATPGPSSREEAQEGADAPAPTPAPEDAAHEDVGVGDFVDYATGAGPVRHGQRMKRRLREIESEHMRKIEEVTGE
jgi:hypothetical protein